MGKIRFFLFAISLGLLTLFNGCGFPNSHRLDEPLYYIKNETAGTIYINVYNRLIAGYSNTFGIKHEANEEQIMSGGGTLNKIQ